MRVIVDAFGGDNAPKEIIKGAVQAAGGYDVDVVLAGSESIIRSVAQREGLSLDGITILDADDVITMEDEPRSILKAHKNSSMGVGLQALAAGEGDAFVSAGSTGALIMGATFIVKRIKGVSRPALAPIIPSDKGAFMLLDGGANAECRPEMLVQFARMGSIYMTELFGEGDPATVGLLNVGTEDTKGDELRQTACRMLKETELNFIGNVEARDVPYGVARVVVADGFSGNVLLKTMEGTTAAMLKNIKSIFMTNLLTKLAALAVKPQLRAFKQKMDTSEYGGAPLLGVTRPVIKAHGNATAKVIQNAVLVAAEYARTGVTEKIEAVMSQIRETE